VFHFFDHTGDIGIEIHAPRLGAAFEEAALAFAETVTDSSALGSVEQIQVSLESEALDLLLVDWLTELLYRFEISGWLPKDAAVDVQRSDTGWILRARLAGGIVDPSRHEVRVLVKAVTYHALELRETADGWHAKVILDI
jgi:SHS2 domain-containing protein